MIFCYKFRTFAEFWNFCLAKYRGRLIHGYSKTCIFWLKNRGGRLIHRFDLYTGKYGIHSFTCIFRLYSILLFIFNFIKLVTVVKCIECKIYALYKTYLLLLDRLIA